MHSSYPAVEASQNDFFPFLVATHEVPATLQSASSVQMIRFGFMQKDLVPALFGVQAVCGATVHSASVEHSVRCGCSGFSGVACFGFLQKDLVPALFGQHLKYKLVKNGDVIRWGIRSAKVDGACRRERRRTSEAVDGVGIANRLTVL